MQIDFQHRMAAHCENGVTANLLRYYGLELSEPMVFGIGAGLFFSYLPFLKVNGIPVASFRPLPGFIFRRITKAFGIKTETKKFRNPETAMKDLDRMLDKGIPVGLLVGVFNLTYFPAPYRFHFNAHNIIVYGKENGTYRISDPIMETSQTLTYEDLKRVRFAKGILKPKGKMYHITHVPENVDIKTAVVKGIKKTCNEMTGFRGPLIGIKGIRYLSKSMQKWPKKVGEKKASLYLGQVVRMQEEIGTGGAGFRFLYAAFLQEASTLLNEDRLWKISEEMTETGDKWRDFAVRAGRICKGRYKTTDSYTSVSELLLEIADREDHIFKKLKDLF